MAGTVPTLTRLLTVLVIRSPMPAHTNWLLFLGRLHPLLVHLPIGFLTLLAGVEVAARFGRFRGVTAARGIVLAATVAAAVCSVIAGLMLSSAGGYDPHLLRWHKWTGITLAALVICTAVAHWRHRKREYVGLLLATLAVLVPASHFGGSMTHGADYLTAYAPEWVRAWAGSPTHRPADVVVVADPVAAHVYADLVRPVFAADCVSCHGPDRSSGRLRLDTLESIRRGGQSGPGVAAVLTRVMLPAGDPKHMPPADQRQLSADQIDALRWWAATGADDRAVVALNPTDEQAALVGRLLHVDAKPVAPPDGPRPWAEVAPVVADLSTKLGIGLSPAVADQPWLTCSARTARSFGDKDLAQLAPLARNVTSLDLAGTAVTDAGLDAVAHMPNLRQLHLDRTHITDAGLTRLARLSHLESLDLYGTDVTDAGLSALLPLPALTKLYLWQTRVTPAATAAFAAARVDQARIREWEAQIADLRAKIAQQHTAVVGGVAVDRPTTAPTTRPVTAPAARTSHARKARASTRAIN